MRIAFVTETFLPKVDGIVHTLCHLLQHVAERGHSALVLAPAGGPLEFAGAPVIGFPAARFPLYRELRLASPFTNIAPPLRAFQPDLVHVLNPVALGLPAIRFARVQRVPLVASYHTDVPGFADRWGWGWVKPALWAYFRAVHNLADLNLAPSQVTRRELEAQQFKRVRVWGRGVDTARFGPHRRSEPWRTRLSGGCPEARLLLYVGRRSAEKRVHWLRPVLDALPEARLAVVGDGPARAALAAQLPPDRTVFTGYLHGEDLASAYAAADVFVFPAANETLGNVILEAMASGLPVVAPRAGGLLDHLVEDRQGLLFAPDDQAEFVARVRQLADAPVEAQRLGVAGRAYAETRRWGQVLDGLLEEYGRLLLQYGRRPSPRRFRRPVSSLS